MHICLYILYIDLYIGIYTHVCIRARACTLTNVHDDGRYPSRSSISNMIGWVSFIDVSAGGIAISGPLTSIGIYRDTKGDHNEAMVLIVMGKH